MNFIRISKFFNTLLVILALSVIAVQTHSAPNLAVFTDREFQTDCLKKGHLKTIVAAKQENAKGLSAREQLLQTYRDSPYFVSLLKTFPEGDNAMRSRCEDEVIDQCSQDIFRYFNVFSQLFFQSSKETILSMRGLSTSPNFTVGYGDHHMQLRALFPKTDVITFCGGFPIHAQFDQNPILPFALRLLQTQVDPIKPTRKMSEAALIRARHIASLRYLAPLFQGDLYLYQRKLTEAQQSYQRSVVPVGKNFQDIPDYKSRRQALALCPGWASVISKQAITDVPAFTHYLEAAIKTHDVIERSFSLLLQAQYLLGRLEFSEEKTEGQIKKGLSILASVKVEGWIPQFACLTEIEHYLGRSKLMYQNLPEALKLLDQALSNPRLSPAENGEEIPPSSIFKTRKAEVLLGLYDDRAPDVPGAIKLLSEVNNVQKLHQVYAGYLCSYEDPYEEATLLRSQQHLEYFRTFTVQRLVREKQYDAAFEHIGDSKSANTAYIKGQLLLNTRCSYYSPQDGLKTLADLAASDYRESRKLFIVKYFDIDLSRRVFMSALRPDKGAFLHQAINVSPWTVPNVIAFADTYLDRLSRPLSPATEERSPESTHSTEERLPENTHATASAARVSSETSDETTARTESTGQESAAPFPDEEEITETFVAMAEADTIVLDDAIEDLMGMLGNVRSFASILNHKGFGMMGGKQVAPKRISIEGIEGVFTFHAPHNRDHFSLTSYWSHLKKMLQERYIQLVTEKLKAL